jgi:hypothetical protein
MPHGSDSLTAEIADLIEQGVETPWRKAERILRMVRDHGAETRERQIVEWFAAHPNAQPVVIADLTPRTFIHTDQEPM